MRIKTGLLLNEQMNFLENSSFVCSDIGQSASKSIKLEGVFWYSLKIKSTTLVFLHKHFKNKNPHNLR